MCYDSGDASKIKGGEGRGRGNAKQKGIIRKLGRKQGRDMRLTSQSMGEKANRGGWKPARERKKNAKAKKTIQAQLTLPGGALLTDFCLHFRYLQSSKTTLRSFPHQKTFETNNRTPPSLLLLAPLKHHQQNNEVAAEHRKVCWSLSEPLGVSRHLGRGT